MTRDEISRLLGVMTALVSTMVLLAGSDLPPPPGFVVVVLLALLLGVLVRWVMVGMLALRDRVGTRSCLLRATALGGGLGAAIATLLMLFSPGEPGVGRDTAAGAIFVIVLGTVGALGGLTLMTLGILGDQARTRAGAMMAVGAPCALAVLIAGSAIGIRLLR